MTSKPLTIGLLTSIGHTLDSFFVEIVQHWTARGIRVTTAAGDRSKNFPEQRIINGLTRNPSLSNRHALSALREWVKEESVDVVITNTATASMLVRAAGVEAKVIYFCHGLHWSGKGSKTIPFRLIEHALVPRTDGIVCINSADDRWFSRYASSTPRLRLKHGVGLDTTRFARRDDLPRWNGQDRLEVAWCGEFIPRKNPAAATSVISALNRRGVTNVHLTMLGKGPLTDSPEIEDRNHDQITLVGHTDPVPYFAKSHVLLQTSHWEGLPRVALEAVSMGLPTAGFDVKGVQDIPGAYLAPKGNIAALADVILGAAEQGPRDLPDTDLLSYEHTAEALADFAWAVRAGVADPKKVVVR